MAVRGSGPYQAPGIPWITGSGANALGPGAEHRVQFPTVARSVLIASVDAENDTVRVHFNASGSGNVITGNHFYPLTQNRDAIVFNVKCTEVYVSNPSATESAGYTVVAELTNIETTDIAVLTGSGLTD
jgi:hypothetical protein